jgi:hypothetical protein
MTGTTQKTSVDKSENNLRQTEVGGGYSLQGAVESSYEQAMKLRLPLKAEKKPKN